MNKSIEKILGDGDLSRATTYQVGVAQATVHRLLQKYCDDILRPYGITKMHWLIIGTVLDAGDVGMRITDLAKIIDTTLPYLTNTLNVLETKGILMRIASSTDSRAKIVSVTPEFAPKCAVIEKTLRHKLRQSIYSNIEIEDFQTYMKVLYQLSAISK